MKLKQLSGAIALVSILFLSGAMAGCADYGATSTFGDNYLKPQMAEYADLSALAAASSATFVYHASSDSATVTIPAGAYAGVLIPFPTSLLSNPSRIAKIKITVQSSIAGNKKLQIQPYSTAKAKFGTVKYIDSTDSWANGYTLTYTFSASGTFSVMSASDSPGYFGFLSNGSESALSGKSFEITKVVVEIE